MSLHGTNLQKNTAASRSGLAEYLLSLAILLTGIAQLAILPPFEGLDEVGHYSSIRQIAETGTMPMLGQSFISPDAIDYRAHGPSPYDLPISAVPGKTPTNSDIITYQKFFASPDLQKDFVARYRDGRAPVAYARITDEFNWEAQHPPLYYLIMAPLMKATDGLPLVSQFFVLRLASFLLAYAGLLIAARATVKYLKNDIAPRLGAGLFLLYPLLVPMFFPEFGRIGNDALCLFLFGLIWSLVLAWRCDDDGDMNEVALGICFGLGLLTKAFFIPLLGGFCLLATVWIARERKSRKVAPHLQKFGLAVGIALLIGAWWYIIQYARNGAMSGSLDAVMLAQHGGLVAGLREHFTLTQFITDIGWTIRSWSWFGTESFVTVPLLWQAPVLVLSVALFVFYAGAILRKSYAAPRWMPFWFIGPFLAALVWHILVCEASNFNFTPGWYLSISAPLFATMMAYGWGAGGKVRILFGLLLVYAIGYLTMVFWAQASLFAGCAVKGPDKLYQFPDEAFCTDRYTQIMGNLSVLGWPNMALFAFGGGILCLVLALIIMRNFSGPIINERQS